MIRRARQDAGITQATLANRAGLSRFSVSRFESGARTPSITQLERLLAVVGVQIRPELEPLDEDVRRRIREIADTPLDDRDSVVIWRYLSWLHPIDHRLEGVAAANALGAPVPVDVFGVGVVDDERTYAGIAAWTVEGAAYVRPPSWDHHTWWPPMRSDDAVSKVESTLGRVCPEGWFWVRTVRGRGRVHIRSAVDVARVLRVLREMAS